MRRLAFALFLFVSSSVAAYNCAEPPLPGHHSDMFHCAYLEWERQPDRGNLQRLLTNLYSAYVTDGANPSLRKFFNRWRSDDPLLEPARARKILLLQKYAHWTSGVTERAALPVLPLQDARMLLVLSATEPASLPLDLAAAVCLTLYSDLESMFFLHLIPERQLGMLPVEEYRRVLEIFQRMAWLPDPYLKGMNLYYQGVTRINLHQFTEGMQLVWRSRDLLKKALSKAQAQIAKKRILYSLASADLVLRNPHEAGASFLAILKMDPQDWNALMSLSRVLNRTGECNEQGVWIEATIHSGEELYDVTIHCGNRELPAEEWFPSEPVIARFASPRLN